MPATGTDETPFTSEEIDLANWLANPEAKRILRSCLFNPPAFERRVKVHAQTRDEWIVATGRRADRLEEIRQAYGARTLNHCQDTGDYRLMRAFVELPTSDAAIMAMLSASPIVRSVRLKRTAPVATGARAAA